MLPMFAGRLKRTRCRLQRGSVRGNGDGDGDPVAIREGCRGRNSFKDRNRETDMNMSRENELWPMAFFVFAMLVMLLVVAVA
jgi:hypothetical protein